jgi:hypothetical protein
MSTDLTEAKALIDASLSGDEQAAFYQAQAKQHAQALLAHVANIERLEGEAAGLSGDDKAQVESVVAENVAAVQVLTRAVSASRVKVAAFEAAKAEPVVGGK